ncbi:tail tape measure protein [Glacieibacterium frigidum]|uniref:Tail tape measure protein n=1 Tax=Glacieibacterium frigidum TaxID=2593303 RepID=A0A552U811_9SPHN|nr:tail tape measure protein [Glacieibacterium frigidum]TRW14358.1 tail tape measure protein [Glacieibacterium frigidum]
MDELDTLVVRVRADTSGFTSGVADMRAQLDGPLASGLDTAARGLERALSRAVTTGKFGFDDLKRVAVAALADIAASAVKADLGALFGGSGGGGGGLLGSIASLFGGKPGRATGGPVTGGSAYLVGERGPELFVPTAAGRVQPLGGRGTVNVTVNVAAPRDAAPRVMAQTGAQVARAVSRALDKAGA